MLRLLTGILCSILTLQALAQEGDYFLTHFVPSGLNGDHQIFDLEQDENGVFYMAHQQGMLIFNGTAWENVPFTTSIFAVEGYGENIYTGGPAGFYQFQRNDNYEWEFVPMHQEGLIRDIIRIAVIDSTLYGLSSTNLYAFDLNTNEARTYSSSGNSGFVNIFNFYGQVHVLDVHGNTYRLNGDRLSITTENIAAKKLIFAARLEGSETYLIGDFEDQLYLYENHEFVPVLSDVLDRKDMDYLAQSEMTSGLWVNDSLVAVSTLKGGVVFLNPYPDGERNVQKIVNYENDLPDNEVFTMQMDNQGAVWVVHEKGFSRIATSYPFRRYDYYPGLEGKIQNVYSHDGVLYVGSSQGLFYLKETPVYEKIEKRYKKLVAVEEKERKGFFNRLFGKKGKAVQKEEKEVVRTKRKFHSIKHEFHKIEPLGSKVFHISEIDGKLFAGGLDGIFEINGDQTRRLTRVPVKYFHYSETRGHLLAATYEGELIQLSLSGSEINRPFTQITEPVNHIFEGREGELFVTGMHTVYKVDSQNKIAMINFENPFYEDTYGIIEDDSVYLINESGIYHLDPLKLETQRVSGIEPPKQLIRGADGQVWLMGPAGWNAPGLEIEKYNHLSAFGRIRFISQTGDMLWVISEHGVDDHALYQLLPRESENWYRPNALFLEEIIAGERKQSPHGKISFDQEESHITFVFNQPDFSGIMSTEFKYELSGDKEERSDWGSGNNTIRFTYLPAGKYRLRVKSRNALGQVSEVTDLDFKVLAPYWKRTWFYALEFAIIALMLLISIRMKAMGYKYRLVSRLLALLTLITIIELIQALAESKFETETSPVIGFIIQVLMAIMILPVEEILRKYIFKEKHVKVFDIFTLREKGKNVPAVDQPAVSDELQSS